MIGENIDRDCKNKQTNNKLKLDSQEAFYIDLRKKKKI